MNLLLFQYVESTTLCSCRSMGKEGVVIGLPASFYRVGTWVCTWFHISFRNVKSLALIDREHHLLFFWRIFSSGHWCLVLSSITSQNHITEEVGIEKMWSACEFHVSIELLFKAEYTKACLACFFFFLLFVTRWNKNACVNQNTSWRSEVVVCEWSYSDPGWEENLLHRLQ